MLLLCAITLGSLSGCSLMVMASKVIMGEPKVTSQFKQRTGVDLIEDEKEVLVVCSTPEFLRTEHSALDRDLVAGMYRRFRVRELGCVNPNKIDTWLSRNGGVWDDVDQLAEEFESDYIIEVEIDDVSYRESSSPNFFRGSARGNVSVYEVKEQNKTRNAYLIFQHEYSTEYPRHYPVDASNMSERTFTEKFNDQIATELARLFYDYRAGNSVN